MILRTLLRSLQPRSGREVLAEIVSLRAQLILAKRKAPSGNKLTPIGRVMLAFVYRFIPKRVLAKTFILVKPRTVLKFHRWLIDKKYSRLYRNFKRKTGRPPLSNEIRTLILEIKEKNPSFGCPQIASIIFDRTAITVSDETVRRVLMQFYQGTPGNGPSWLSFLSTQVDSLWSLDFFQVESVLLKTHWVLVVMDQWSRRIVGFAVSDKPVSATGLSQMFCSVVGVVSPKRLSHDHDPLFRSFEWKRIMAVESIEDIWSIPFVPISHPFVERLIGTIRRDFLDQTLFWNQTDLQRKLAQYQEYFNEARVHSGISGKTPNHRDCDPRLTTGLESLKWKSFCNSLFIVPMAA